MSSFPPPYPYFNGITYDSAFFNPSSSLTLAQANAKFLKKSTPDTATALETFQAGVQTDLIKSYGGFGGTIYTDPGPTQTYSTLVCQNNSTCSFGGSAGTCNLGGLSSGINIGYNMPTATQITIATAPLQDSNVAISTRGVYPTGTNKILIGASANTTTLSSGTTSITSGTTNIGSSADSAISIGSSASQSSNILIGTKGAIISGTDKIAIGSSTNNTTISGNNLNLGATSLNINSPLTIGYSIVPTAITQIGGTTEVFFASDITGIPNTGQTIATLTIGTAGVFIINYSFRYAGATTAVANCESWFQTSTGGTIQYGNQAYYSNPNAVMGSNVICQAGSAVITTTSVSTITFSVYITYTGGAPKLDKTFSYYSYTRLA